MKILNDERLTSVLCGIWFIHCIYSVIFNVNSIVRLLKQKLIGFMIFNQLKLNRKTNPGQKSWAVHNNVYA